MNKTDIPYLDYTWNPTHGCSPCSPGCDNCWARAMSKRLAGMGVKGYDKADPFRPTFHAERLNEPLKLRKPAVIGVSFMGDLFHEDISFEAIARVWDTVFDCSGLTTANSLHTFVILTKRPSRLRQFSEWMLDKYSRRIDYNNLWVGVTVCNQAEADEKIPILLSIPAAHRWVSIEPMLTKIQLEEGPDFYKGLDWIVAGAESGPRARHCDPAWLLSVVDQAIHYEIPLFIKQVQLHGKLSKDPSEWPESLRIQQTPFEAAP